MNKITLIAVAVLAVVGCQKKSSSGVYNTDPSVTQVGGPAPVAYQPAPAPYQAQPVIYDSAPAPAYTAPAAPVQSAGGSYTVKKGDTLYSIAKTRYGNGNQYSKIVNANPGLDPSKLKVGQTITIPQ